MDDPAVNRSYAGTSLPPGIQGKQKGELILELQRIDWSVTPPDFRSGCSMSIHWWGQSPSDNLVLVIPNGTCPPSVTTVYPLVSSRNQIYRYFKDMAALEFCLVVGVQSTNENFGITMGSFSMEIDQLSDDHPLESNIPVLDKSGVRLASITLKISLEFGPDWHLASERPFLDALDLNVISSLVHSQNLIGDLSDTFSNRVATPSALSDRRKQLFMEFDVPPTGQEHLLSGSAGADPLTSRKPLIVDVEVPPGNRGPRSPREQLVLDIEVPTAGRDPPSRPLHSSDRRRQIVMDVEVPSPARSKFSSTSGKSSPIFNDVNSSPANLKQALEGKHEAPSKASSPSSQVSAPVSPAKVVRSKNQKRVKILPGKTKPSAKPQPLSPARLRSRRPKRRAVNAKSGQQSLPPERNSGNSPKGVTLQNIQTYGAKVPGGSRRQSVKMTPPSKQPVMLTNGMSPSTPRVRPATSPQKSSKVQQKLTVLSTATSKSFTPRPKHPLISKAASPTEGSMTPRRAKKSPTGSSLRSRVAEEGNASPLTSEDVQDSTTPDVFLQCKVHLTSEGAPVPDVEILKNQKYLDPPDRHRLSGNLAFLPPDDMFQKPLKREPTDKIFNDSHYRESVQKLIHQIVTFRASLNKSAVACADVCAPTAAPNDEEDKGAAAYVVENFKQLEDNIGSVNQLLTSLLTEKKVNDGPAYARVAHTDILEEDPRDVAEVALLEELFFPQKDPHEFREATVPKSKKNGARKPLEDICQIHNEAPPLKQVFVDGLQLRLCEGKPTELKKETTKPSLESVCGLHEPQEPSDSSPALNLCLTLNVGKLSLTDSTSKEAGAFAPAFSSDPAEWSFKQGLKTSSCSLTISFPGLNSSKSASISAPEQSITISPTQLDFSEVHFGHESQLHWKNVKMESLEIWKSKRMMICACLSWESGQSLKCQGSVLLEEVFSLMPKAFKTKLGLHTTTQGKAPANCSSPVSVVRTDIISCSDGCKAEMEGTQASILDIAIDLLVEDSSGKPVMGAWLYVTVPCITGSELQPEGEKSRGPLLLVVKSDLLNVCHIPFPVDWKASSGGAVKAWSPLKRCHPDGVLRGPKQMENPTVFIEVWRNWSARELTHMANADNLIGLAKVPLKCCSNGTTVKDRAIAVAEGEYYIWNPFKDVICGSLEARIMLGPEGHVLKLQQQNRAARVIQGHAPCRRDGTRAGKRNFSSSIAEYNPFRQRGFPKDFRRKMVKHVIEVTVQHVTDLPETDTSAKCEGTFIKYLFPWDEEPFYTQTMKWSKTIHFSATVHHGIILPSGQRLDNHLRKMNGFTADDGDLIFELWGCFASLSEEETYPPSEINLSDAGAMSSWDMRRNRSCKHESGNAKSQERLLGTAKLLQWSLLNFISSRQTAAPEVRKRFYVPIELESSLIGTFKRAPSLAVQVAYFNMNKESRKDHIEGTIFSNVDIHEDSLFEGVVEFDINGATGLQDAEAIHELSTERYFVHGVNSYVRYSLFSSNKQLAAKYPPRLTPVQANSCTPRYNWTGRLKVLLNVQVLKELRTGQMSFEVWHHHFPRARRNVRPLVPMNDSMTTDVLLGTALIPTLPLLESRQGVEGWHDLISRKGQILGAINLQVYFKHWQILPLGFTMS